MSYQVAKGGNTGIKFKEARPDMSKRAAKRMLKKLDKAKKTKTNKGGFA